MTPQALWLGLIATCLIACAQQEPAPPLVFNRPRDAGTKDAGKDPQTSTERDTGVPRDCEVASDCRPGPCERVQCIDGRCVAAEDRPTELGPHDGTINVGGCGDGYACGPGIGTRTSCCEESCPNGCGGQMCACDTAGCTGPGRSAQYCCGGVIYGDVAKYPASPKCEDTDHPPCRRLDPDER